MYQVSDTRYKVDNAWLLPSAGMIFTGKANIQYVQYVVIIVNKVFQEQAFWRRWYFDEI